MSRTYKDSKGKGSSKNRNLRVRAVRRDPPDLHKLSRALIELARAQAEAEAENQARAALNKKQQSEVGDE